MVNKDKKALFYENLLIMRMLNKMFEEGLAEAAQGLGLTFPQSFVLSIVYYNEGIMPSKIARIGSWHISTVTSLLDALLRKQLIYLSALERGKGSRVFLSEQGKLLAQKAFMISSGRLKVFVDEVGTEYFKDNLEFIYHIFTKIDGGEYESLVRGHMLEAGPKISTGVDNS